ncbi:MAG: hypothetical protein NT139_00625 [Candidatus Woesearchaeota archaeon]|nr:hypothetical protein [Candidatus Woesearchaeota archaeon]
MKKIIISLILVLLIIPIANAITGSIGNAKAIIKTEVIPGETTVLERTILVKNVNDIPLNITLEPDDVLKDIIEIFDEKFVLQPGEEKKARFNLNIERPGTYDGRISVFFTPGNKEAGVVLASNLIINAYGEGDFPEEQPVENTTIENNPEEIPEETNKDNESGVKVSLGGEKVTSSSKSSISGNLIFIIIMIIILLLIIGGAIYFLRKW